VPDLAFDAFEVSDLDSALRRYRAFIEAHPEFEPVLRCIRNRTGGRRFELTVWRRTDAEAEVHRVARQG
jgi:hypothetical protein